MILGRCLNKGSFVETPAYRRRFVLSNCMYYKQRSIDYGGVSRPLDFSHHGDTYDRITSFTRNFLVTSPPVFLAFSRMIGYINSYCRICRNLSIQISTFYL